MDTGVLEDIGLSKTEVRVFVTILGLGESKAGKIIEKTNLQSSSVYNSINSLINKGFVSYIKRGQVKFYEASDPEIILDYIDEKKEQYLKLLPSLKKIQSEKKQDEAEFFKSFKGVKAMLRELIKDMERGDIYRTFSAEDPDQYHLSRAKVFSFVKQSVKEKKIVTKGIFHEKTRHERDKDSLMQKKYVDFSMPPNTVITNNKVGIFSWEREPYGILINSKDIANSYKKFFDHLWKNAKK
jgi:sugar-specific transcriptional regulator TrmB